MNASSFGRRLPVPDRLAGVLHQLVDRGDRDVALLVAEDHAAEHHFLAQLLGFRLDHQHRGFGAGDDQVHLRLGHLRLGRIQHVLAADVADARGADRAVERNARDRQCGARADQRRDVGGDFRVERQHVDDDLDFVVEAFGEERPERPVDQPRGQRLELARTAFALEEAARDLAGGIGLLDVVDGQREEVLARLGVLLGDDGGEDDGVFDRHHDGAARLAGDLTGFQGDGLVAPLEGLGDFVEDAHGVFLRCFGRHRGGTGTRRRELCRRNAIPRVLDARLAPEHRWNDTASPAGCSLQEIRKACSRDQASRLRFQPYLRRPSLWIRAV